jgi:hypothetical protein
MLRHASLVDPLILGAAALTVTVVGSSAAHAQCADNFNCYAFVFINGTRTPT